jgi:protein O-GlcNAc transferase
MFAWLKKQLSPKINNSEAPATHVEVAATLFSGDVNFLEQGNALLQAGELDGAEKYYQEAIVFNPEDTQAHNRLGDVFFERQLFPAAEVAYRRALQINPNFVDANINLGLTLVEQERFDEAEVYYRKVIAYEPIHALAFFNLAVCLAAQGRHEEAETNYLLALEIKPKFSHGYFNLAHMQQLQGRLDDAELNYRSAIESDPSFLNAYFNLSGIFNQQERYIESEAILTLAIETVPTSIQAQLILSNTLMLQGRQDHAESWLWKVIEAKPDQVNVRDALLTIILTRENDTKTDNSFLRLLNIVRYDAFWHYNLGLKQGEKGRLAEAIACYRSAIEIEPNLVEAHYNLGCTDITRGSFLSAETYFRRALEINPEHSLSYAGLALVSIDKKQLSEAEAYCLKAIKLDPNVGNNFSLLGSVFKAQGRLKEAGNAFLRAISIEPELAMKHVELASWLLFCHLENDAISSKELFDEHCRFGAHYEAPFRAKWPIFQNNRDPDRVLKIGFVSADLYNHAVASFFEPLLDRLVEAENMSIHVYYNNNINDNVCRRMQEKVKQWRCILDCPDEELAQQIMDDGIDILIDLSGHTSMHRLLVFARRAAPIQVSWMGYPGTTGFSTIDYYLSDRFILPLGQFEDQFIEKIVRLPANAPFHCADNPPPLTSLPALHNGFITFASFNRPSKINREVITLWSKVLRAVPTAQMVIAGIPPDDNNLQICSWFKAEGISQTRLRFYPRSGMAEYLRLHQQVDVCLDTFPYSGGTTTMHALWMGVPTVTLAGRTVPSRTTTGVLGQIGLESFVAQNYEEFVQNACTAISDLPALSALRAGLRDRIEQSAPGRPGLIASGLERALRIMWQRWCEDLPAQSFEVLEQDLFVDPNTRAS